MRDLISGERVRVVTLYAGLIAMFGLASAAQHWPSYTMQCLAAAIGIVCAQIGAMYVSARRRMANDRAASDKNAADAESSPPFDESIGQLTLFGMPVADAPTSPERLVAAERLHRHYRIQNINRILELSSVPTATRLRITHPVAWQLVTRPTDLARLQMSTLAPDEIAALVESWRELTSAREEMNRWRVKGNGPNAFNVSAGAFEIEHFHGQTHIRVLDSSKVSVSGPRVVHGEVQTDCYPEFALSVH